MKFKATNIIWGLVFIIMGGLLYCKAFLGWNISIWYLLRTFWPLFIILPSVSGMFTKGFNMSSLFGLLIGTTALLMTTHLVTGDLIRKLVFPASFIIIGLGLVFKDLFKSNKTSDNDYKKNINFGSNDNFNQDSNFNNSEHNYDSNTEQKQSSYDNNNHSFSYDSMGQKKPEYSAIFASSKFKYPNDIFTGTCINSIFGSVVLDLRDAIINEDVVINASVIFAGADIYVPSNVNIKVSSVPIFGGVSNKVYNQNVSGPTIFINATCMFGGLDIK